MRPEFIKQGAISTNIGSLPVAGNSNGAHVDPRVGLSSKFAIRLISFAGTGLVSGKWTVPLFGIRVLERQVHARVEWRHRTRGASVRRNDSVEPERPLPGGGSTVVDLSTGATRTAAGGFPEGGPFGIGNIGSLLVLTVHQAFIVSNVDLTLSSRPGVLMVNAPEVLDAVVSAVENRVVYEIWGDTAATRDQVWSYDVASGGLLNSA